MRRSPLDLALELVGDAVQVAHLHGDRWQADRLMALGHAIEHEVEYAANRDRGLAVVRSPRSSPCRTLGWYLRHDAHIRALRRARGVWVPEVGSTGDAWTAA